LRARALGGRTLTDCHNSVVMQAALTTVDGNPAAADEASIRKFLDARTPFWLDLTGGGSDATHLLRDVFGFHALAVEDAEHFHQRPKVDDYDDYIFLVMYGATTASKSSLVEIHCFYSERYLVTIHHGACPELAQLAERLRQTGRGPHPTIMLLHGVLDVLIDGFFPALAEFDDEIDELEDAILARPTDAQLGRLFEMKRSLVSVRKVVTPARDTLASIVTGVGQLPGMTPEAERYFRDLYDHLIRISDLVDSYRDLLSGVLDTHLSTVSNRLNAIMKQLTIIATFFLPLTFLTGFFGQNFGVLVDNITSWTAFLVFGIGLEALAVVGLLLMFWMRGWIGRDPGTAAVPSIERSRRPRNLRLVHTSRAAPR
jgi:magnesium transporter